MDVKVKIVYPPDEVSLGEHVATVKRTITTPEPPAPVGFTEPTGLTPAAPPPPPPVFAAPLVGAEFEAALAPLPPPPSPPAPPFVDSFRASPEAPPPPA